MGVLEAMTFACPSVSPQVVGIREVTLDAETGVLVPPGDLPGLVEALT